MASINMSSILAKAKMCMNSNKKKNEVIKFVDDAIMGSNGATIRTSGGSIHSPEEAAKKFIEVLQATIQSSGLSQGAIAAISNITHDSAISLGGNAYTIRVYFNDDMSRPSLDPKNFPGGIDDLVALFNNGVDHKMRPVHGVWHGEEAWSKTVIPGTHFVEQAISDFMGSYASEYNVTSITANGIDN